MKRVKAASEEKAIMELYDDFQLENLIKFNCRYIGHYLQQWLNIKLFLRFLKLI
jgi:hypothetical protein